ncbi:MAG: hypothetical protein ABIB12_02930 [Patescibacteria group bacterium]
MRPILTKIITFSAGAALFAGVPFAEIPADQATGEEPPSISQGVPVVADTALLASAPHFGPTRVKQQLRVVITAYSSTPEQTDSTPFITASGTSVRDGVVAANFLPIGTKIMIPGLYGEKIFVVEDRMHPRKGYQVDIWFPTYWEAKNFGAKNATIAVLEG